MLLWPRLWPCPRHAKWVRELREAPLFSDGTVMGLFEMLFPPAEVKMCDASSQHSHRNRSVEYDCCITFLFNLPTTCAQWPWVPFSAAEDPLAQSHFVQAPRAI